MNSKQVWKKQNKLFFWRWYEMFRVRYNCSVVISLIKAWIFNNGPIRFDD